MAGPQFAFGNFVLDPGTRRLLKDGQAIAIPARTFDTLAALVRSAGRLVERDDLLHWVWPEAVVDEANLGQQIFLLRKLLGEGAKERRYIATVPRRGYRFVAPVVEVTEGWPAAVSAAVDARGVPLRLALMLPPGTPLALGACPPFALSPDGRVLAYISLVDETTGLFLRRLDRTHSVRVDDSAGAYSPFFSCDSRWVGFFARGRMRRVLATGGVPETICEAGDECRGASWGSRDEIVFAPAPAAGLSAVAANGGTPRPATNLDFDRGERTHRWPCLLPNGSDLLLTVALAGSASFDDANIEIASLDTGERRHVLRHATCARYVPTGHIAYMHGGSMMVVPFNPERKTISGSATPVVQRVTTQPTGSGHFAFAATGTLMYLSGKAHQVLRQLVKLDPERGLTPLPIPKQAFEEPRLSPDGRRLAIGIRSALTDIWLYDLPQGPLTRVTFEADNFAPIWTPDGKRLTFSSNRNGPCQIYWCSLGADGQAEPLVGGDHDLVPGAWASDGERLIFTEYHPATGASIWVCSPGRNTAPEPVVRTSFNEYSPALSPDDRCLAYTSDESGRAEVYVVPFPAADRRIQISANGGSEPIWARDGSHLYYRSGSSIMRVEYKCGEPIAAAASCIADGPYLAGAVTGLPNYDVTPEGEFLMIEQEAAQARPDELSVIVNWFAELSEDV